MLQLFKFRTKSAKRPAQSTESALTLGYRSYELCVWAQTAARSALKERKRFQTIHVFLSADLPVLSQLAQHTRRARDLPHTKVDSHQYETYCTAGARSDEEGEIKQTKKKRGKPCSTRRNLMGILWSSRPITKEELPWRRRKTLGSSEMEGSMCST